MRRSRRKIRSYAIVADDDVDEARLALEGL